LALYQKLYPAAQFPGGHAHLALSLSNLGFLLREGGELAGAEPFPRDALARYHALVATFAEAAAEAEALNYMTQIPRCREVFLSLTTQRADAAPAAVYDVLWQGRAVLARVLER